MVVVWYLVLVSKWVLLFPPIAVLLVCGTGAACEYLGASLSG